MRRRLILFLVAAVFLLGLSKGRCTAGAEEETFKITVEGGYAILLDAYWDEVGIVTEAPKHNELRICFEVPAGYYVEDFTVTKADGSSEKHWHASYYFSYQGVTSDGKTICSFTTNIFSEDCTVAPVLHKQTPKTIDLSSGIFDFAGMEYEEQKTLVRILRENFGGKYPDDRKYDLNRDGQTDILEIILAIETPCETSEGELNGIPYLVPAAGGTLTGSYTVEQGVLGPYCPITFVFGNETAAKEYAVSVKSGRAADENGTTITKAEPGQKVYLIAETMRGRYVKSWKDETVGTVQRIGQDSFYQDRVPFIMPAHEVSFTPEVDSQVPKRIDLTEGFWISPRDSWESRLPASSADCAYNYRLGTYLGESAGAYSFGKMDYDGDGSYDAVAGQYGEIGNLLGWDLTSWFLIPLPTSSIQGEYTISDLNDGPFWPYTICFPDKPVSGKYKVNIKGGHAEDQNGKVITEAAPGTVVAVKTATQLYLEATPAYYQLHYSYYNFEPTAYFVMPAADITYAAEGGGDGGDGETDREITVSFVVSEEGTMWVYDIPSRDFDAVMKAWESLRNVYGRFDLSLNGYRMYMNLNNMRLYEAGTEDFACPNSTFVDNIHCVFPEYPVTVVGGVAYENYERIYTSVPGHRIEVYMEQTPNDSYRYAVLQSDEVTLKYYKENGYEFIMPNCPVTVRTELKEGSPLVINLNSGTFPYNDEMLLCISESCSGNWISGKLDLNGDGKPDIRVDQDKKTIQGLPTYSCGDTYQLEKNNPGPYYPVTFLFDVANAKFDPTPVPNEPVEPTQEVKPTGKSDGESKEEPKEEKGKKTDEEDKGFNPLWVILSGVALLAVAASLVWVFIIKPKKASGVKTPEAPEGEAPERYAPEAGAAEDYMTEAGEPEASEAGEAEDLEPEDDVFPED